MMSAMPDQSFITAILSCVTMRRLALVMTFAAAALTSQSAQAQVVSKVLYSFTNGADGGQPYAALIRDSGGNLYGTTAVGGASNFGAVFKLSKTGKETVLHSFSGGTDGANPWTGLVWGPGGNLYGTTEAGGSSGFGTVFKISKAGKKTILYNFTGTAGDGAYPFAQMIWDGAKNSMAPPTRAARRATEPCSS
jgi:uncharacterized repeat protein (TIGR03803 family)